MSDKACTKVKFATESYAIEHIKKLKATSRRMVVPQRAYLCEHCNCWHLTSQQPTTHDLYEKRVEKLKVLIDKKDSELKKLRIKIYDLTYENRQLLNRLTEIRKLNTK